jgi:hypothetical protein
MAISIFQRKRDLVYLVFFIVHLPVMLGEYKTSTFREASHSPPTSCAIMSVHSATWPYFFLSELFSTIVEFGAL